MLQSDIKAIDKKLTGMRECRARANRSGGCSLECGLTQARKCRNSIHKFEYILLKVLQNR